MHIWNEIQFSKEALKAQAIEINSHSACLMKA